MRRFRSLEDFRRFIDAASAKNDETAAINDLGNSVLIDPSLTAAPADPFSKEYFDFVLNSWERLSGRTNYNAETHEKIPINVGEWVARPAAYQHDSAFLGTYLEAYGHALRQIDANRGMRVLEIGSGDAQISLHLARLGCDVTVIDIEPLYLHVARRQAEMMGFQITTVQGGFLDGMDLPKFDRIFFFQAFHHSLEHQQALQQFRNMLTPDGKIVFATEAIVDANGPWKEVVPYPWGLRLDGLSLRAIITHGWMELGFQEPYFETALLRFGLSCDKQESNANGLCCSYTARPIDVAAAPQIIGRRPYSRLRKTIGRTIRRALRL
jgi:SAM-dependent methyltransferase